MLYCKAKVYTWHTLAVLAAGFLLILVIDKISNLCTVLISLITLSNKCIPLDNPDMTLQQVANMNAHAVNLVSIMYK